MKTNNSSESRNDLKGKTGLHRLINAVYYSKEGYFAAYRDEEAFRQIVHTAVIALPLAWWLSEDWRDGILLAGVFFLSVIVELLNSALENTVDRVSLELHPLAKKAKDMGSAAQFTSQCLIVLVWGTYIIHRFF